MSSPTPPPGVPALCQPFDLACTGGKVAGHVQNTVLDGFAQSIQEAVGKVMAALATFWVDVPTPVLTVDDAGTPSDTVGFLQNSLSDITLTLAVIGVIVGGTRMAWEQRAEPGKQLIASMITFVVVSGAGLTVVSILTQAADAFASWIIEQSTGGDFGKNLTATMGGGQTLDILGSFLMIILGIGAVFGGLLQLALMIGRSGALVVLSGTLPASASATNTERGKAWFQRTVAWLLAFILYKPAAALVYSAAFRLTGQNAQTADGVVAYITGLGLMFLAVFSLPAMMKLAAPAVGAVAERGGSAGAFGGAVAALPTGAMVMRGTGGGASGGSSAGAGQRAPTGAAMPVSPSGGGGGTPTGGAGAGAAAAGGPWVAAGVAAAQAPTRIARGMTPNPPGAPA